MKNPENQIVLGAVFALAWLLLGGGFIYDGLTEGGHTTAEYITLGLTAFCGFMFGATQIYKGCQRMKNQDQQSD